MSLQEDGFAFVGDIATDGECDSLAESVAVSTRRRVGARNLLSNAEVRRSAASPALRDVVSKVLGNDTIAFRATLFSKQSPRNWGVAWHQDIALPVTARISASGWGPWSEKAGVVFGNAPREALERVLALRLNLDDSTVKNGPLRVVRSSHLLGVLSPEGIANVVQTGSVVECCGTRGSALLMSPLLVHSSRKAETPAPRRVLHIEYAASEEILPGVHVAPA